MKERTENAFETFLVAVDKETGKIAGFLNGVATDEEVFRDEFFTDMIEKGILSKYEPEAKKETDNIEEVNIEDLLFEGQGGQMMFF